MYTKVIKIALTGSIHLNTFRTLINRPRYHNDFSCRTTCFDCSTAAFERLATHGIGTVVKVFNRVEVVSNVKYVNKHHYENQANVFSSRQYFFGFTAPTAKLLLFDPPPPVSGVNAPPKCGLNSPSSVLPSIHLWR